MLIHQIERELTRAKHCAIYEAELNRIWPNDGKLREPLIAQFAQDNGFRLRFYRDGLCAIFDKEPQRDS
jgi:hypothetical protein